MKKIILTFLLFLTSLFNFSFVSYGVSSDVKWILQDVAKNRAWELWVDAESSRWVRDIMINIWRKVIFPIVIVIWLLIAFIGFYKLMFSDKEDERKKWQNFFIWWTLWVILMVTASFLTYTLVWQQWISGIIGAGENYDAANIAERLYSTIFHKFFVLAMYIVLSLLFVILVINLIKFMTKPDSEEVNKNSKIIIIRNTLWIILIIFAKNIVEMFYKKVESGNSSLAVGGAILENKNIWWLYTILNYSLWFVAFLITVFIIYQAFMLITKPDDDNMYKNLKRNFVYVLVWVLLVGWVYIIANFFIIK